MMMRIAVFLLMAFVGRTHAQNSAKAADGIYAVSKSLDDFGARLLGTTHANLDNTYNIALSPLTVWTLLAIVSEGAEGNTLKQLQDALHLPADMTTFRNNYQLLARNLLRNQDGVQVDVTNAFFVTDEFPLNATFKQLSQEVYNVDINTVDFADTTRSLDTINSYIADATQQRIVDLVNPDDIAMAQIFITSVLYFKGAWRYPFNRTLTTTETFFADDGKTPIGTVEMMYHSAPFPYTALADLKAFVAELPYGNGDRFGMFLVVPTKNEKLANVLEKLARTDFAVAVIEKLAQAAREFEDEEIDIYLPRFRVVSEYTLNVVLNQMGITDVFNVAKAKLGGIVPQYLFLNRLLQKATIDVDEEGTVATSAAGGAFAYKTMKPKLKANKPFAFFIVDKQTRSVIFEGKVSNPRGICATCTGI